MMKIKWIDLIISYLPVSEYLIDSDSEYIIVSLWNIVGCIASPKRPKVNVTSIFWIIKARCALHLLLIRFLCLQCWTNCVSCVNPDTSKYGRIEMDSLWLTSGNTFFVFCSYMNVSSYASAGYCSSSSTAQSQIN